MAPKAEPKFTVGQEVWMVGRHRGDRRTTVEKVGRLYFSVAASEMQFSLDTGYEKGDRYGNGYKVRTLEEQAVLDRQQAAYLALEARRRDHGSSRHRRGPD